MIIVFPKGSAAKGYTIKEEGHDLIRHNIVDAIEDFKQTEKKILGTSFTRSIKGLEHVLKLLDGNT